MSLIISFKTTLSANFVVDIDDIEEATDDPNSYSELYHALEDSDEFLEEYVLPAFKKMLDDNDVVLETIGDEMGRKTVHTDAVWSDYVGDEFIIELKHDQLVADLHKAVDDGDYSAVTRIAALLSGQDIKQPWE